MANIIILTVVLRKEVPDIPTAKSLYETIKAQMTQYPEVKISGQVNEKFDTEV